MTLGPFLFGRGDTNFALKKSMAKLPVFTTERLILREVTEADVASYEENFVDYEVISQLAVTIPWPYPEAGP